MQSSVGGVTKSVYRFVHEGKPMITSDAKTGHNMYEKRWMNRHHLRVVVEEYIAEM